MIRKSCKFDTERLSVREWHSVQKDGWIQQDLPQVIVSMLTPKVTRSLPDGWQGDYTPARAQAWIEERDQESVTLLVLERITRTPIGLMFLFENDHALEERTVRIGYLLAETAWGQGFASELVQGFVGWCSTVDIKTVIAGVAHDNISSQRVLYKNGFVNKSCADDTGELFFELHL